MTGNMDDPLGHHLQWEDCCSKCGFLWWELRWSVVVSQPPYLPIHTPRTGAFTPQLLIVGQLTVLPKSCHPRSHPSLEQPKATDHCEAVESRPACPIVG